MEKSRYNKRITIFAVIFSSLLLLTGCLEEVELDEKVIVAMVGIDRTDEGKIKVTMGLLNTRSIEEKDPKAVVVYSSEGETIIEAVRSSILKVGRQPQWPYIKVLVLGPAFTEEECVLVLDFFNRNNEIQPNPKIVFSHQLAEEIVKLHTDLSNIPALIVESGFKHQNLVGFNPDIELYQFTEMMLTPEQVGIASIINKTEENNQNVPQLGGTAVIKGGKWIGDLNNLESRGLLWVRKEVDGGIIVIPSIEGNGHIALEILGEKKVQIDPILTNGHLSVTVDLEQLVSIAEVFTYLDLNEENINEIRKATENEIKREIETTLQKTKEWQVDVLGIDRAVHRKYPTYWQEHKDNWGETFASVPVDINVVVDLKTIGLIRSLPKNK